MIWIALAAEYEGNVYVLTLELFFKVISHHALVHPMFAAIDIGTEKSPRRKGMDADMAFGKNDDPRYAPGHFQRVVGCVRNERL